MTFDPGHWIQIKLRHCVLTMYISYPRFKDKNLVQLSVIKKKPLYSLGIFCIRRKRFIHIYILNSSAAT